MRPAEAHAPNCTARRAQCGLNVCLRPLMRPAEALGARLPLPSCTGVVSMLATKTHCSCAVCAQRDHQWCSPRWLRSLPMTLHRSPVARVSQEREQCSGVRRCGLLASLVDAHACEDCVCVRVRSRICFWSDVSVCIPHYDDSLPLKRSNL